MMTTARKSFALSLAFHALMGSLAFLLLTQMDQPPSISRIPFKIMSLSPAEHRISIPLPETAPAPAVQPPAKVVPTPTPTNKTLITEIPVPVRTAVAPVRSVAQAPTPITSATAVSAPTPIQRPIQHVAAPVSTPPKPKIDLASEKKSFFSSLRADIQNQLRYPPAARRRGMEGEVEIRFLLSSDGVINHISIQRGESIFHNAALAAVNAASGIDVPKNLTESMPMEIELTLEFKLNS